MEWKSLLWCVSVFSHIVFTTVSSQLSCNQEQYMYSPTSCLELGDQDQQLSNQAAQTECINRGLTELATFEEFDQFEALQGFVEVLLQEDDVVWLGYYYNANNDVLVRGSGEVTESAVFDDPDNFASGGVSPGVGVCIAIRRDGLLQRETCSVPQPYACYQNQAPRVTSISIDGSRFLTTAETRTLTCNYQPSNADVSWRRNTDSVSDTPQSMISPSPGQSNLTISEFQQQAGNVVDLFECVVSNSLGGVVSEAIGLVEVQTAGSGTDMPVPTISSIDTSPEQSDIRTDSSVTLTCNSNDTLTSATYSWFRDGARIQSITTRTFQPSSFLPGFYQCRAALSSGENTLYTIRLDARDPPKADDTISATPFDRTSILVAWSPAPDFARDPLLLRYTLFYTDDAPESPLNTSTANSMPDLLPLLRNGSVSRNGRLEYVLSNLEIGTEYWLSVRTSYLELEGEESEVFAFSSTYGNVPVDTVSNLEVSRTKNNKSLVASWNKLVSKLPVGEIVVYQIEYRNRGKDIIMTARISATFDFFSILELEDASAYEVRVRAGVQVSSDPVVYEYGEPTNWMLADSVVEVIPSPPPTLPVRPLPGGAIAAIVVVVVLVSALVIIILVVGLIAYLMKGKKDNGNGDSRGRTQSFIALKKSDENEKEGSPS